MSTQQLRSLEMLVVKMQTQLDTAASLLHSIKSENVTTPKWEPEGVDWFVDSCGDIVEFDSEDSSRKFGAERSTKDKAKIAAIRMKQSNLLHAWIAENVDDPLNVNVKYKIEFESDSVAIVIYAPSNDIMKLNQLVDDGVVVF